MPGETVGSPTSRAAAIDRTQRDVFKNDLRFHQTRGEVEVRFLIGSAAKAARNLGHRELTAGQPSPEDEGPSRWRLPLVLDQFDQRRSV
jgi:hypothetical protein